MPCVRLPCRATSWWGNLIKYFFSSLRTLISCMGSIAWSSKICAFGVTLSPSLIQFFMEAVSKAPNSLMLSPVGWNLRKHKKAPPSWRGSFSCVLHTCLIFLLAIYHLMQPFKKINFMYYILRVSYETPNTHTIDLNPMVSLSFYSIFMEHPIYCNFNIIITAPSISQVIIHIINQHELPGW